MEIETSPKLTRITEVFSTLSHVYVNKCVNVSYLGTGPVEYTLIINFKYGQFNCLQEISFVLQLAALAIYFGIKLQHIFTETKPKAQERFLLQVTYAVYTQYRPYIMWIG